MGTTVEKACAVDGGVPPVLVHTIRWDARKKWKQVGRMACSHAHALFATMDFLTRSALAFFANMTLNLSKSFSDLRFSIAARF